MSLPATTKVLCIGALWLSGQAVINKMPLVMQNSMQFMQSRIASLLPKLKQIQEETVAELKAAE